MRAKKLPFKWVVVLNLLGAFCGELIYLVVLEGKLGFQSFKFAVYFCVLFSFLGWLGFNIWRNAKYERKARQWLREDKTHLPPKPTEAQLKRAKRNRIMAMVIIISVLIPVVAIVVALFDK